MPGKLEDHVLDINCTHYSACESDNHPCSPVAPNYSRKRKLEQRSSIRYGVVGIVAQVGRGAGQFSEGDRVFFLLDRCTSVIDKQTKPNGHLPDTIRIPSRAATRLPQDLRSTDATHVICSSYWTWSSLSSRIGPCFGQRLAIVGPLSFLVSSMIWALSMDCEQLQVICSSETDRKVLTGLMSSPAVASDKKKSWTNKTKILTTEPVSEWLEEGKESSDLLIYANQQHNGVISPYSQLVKEDTGRIVRLSWPDLVDPCPGSLPLAHLESSQCAWNGEDNDDDVASPIKANWEQLLQTVVDIKWQSPVHETSLRNPLTSPRLSNGNDTSCFSTRAVLVNEQNTTLFTIDDKLHSLDFPTTAAEYLAIRLRQFGIRSIHGVPGGYNLFMVDSILKSGLKWVGNCNELNAGYAADGYARINGMGALLTTFGVGELSAINAVAGAYAERIPLMHIVGSPSTAAQQPDAVLHHSLGSGQLSIFEEMTRKVTCAVVSLRDIDDAPAMIDEALWTCWSRKLPACLVMPADIARMPIKSTTRLQTPLTANLPVIDHKREQAVANEILEQLYASKDAIVIIDSHVLRESAIPEVKEFIDQSHLDTFVTPMGKGGISEQHPSYSGLYTGQKSEPPVAKRVRDADLIIRIGPLDADFNTCGPSSQLPKTKLIDICPLEVIIKNTPYRDIAMRSLLGVMTKLITLARIPRHMPSINDDTVLVNGKYSSQNGDGTETETILHDWLWPRLGGFLQENDIIITESGTSCFGIWDTPLSKGVSIVNQLLWCSIGYALAACQGVSLAVRDANLGRRVILFVGDGSLQVSVQELSTIIWQGLTPIIFVICNDGYTTERHLGSRDASYNDINPWNIADLISAFGGVQNGVLLHKAHTRSDVEVLFRNPDVNEAATLQIIELHMPKYDIPRGLKLATSHLCKPGT